MRSSHALHPDQKGRGTMLKEGREGSKREEIGPKHGLVPYRLPSYDTHAYTCAHTHTHTQPYCLALTCLAIACLLLLVPCACQGPQSDDVVLVGSEFHKHKRFQFLTFLLGLSRVEPIQIKDQISIGIFLSCPSFLHHHSCSPFYALPFST